MRTTFERIDLKQYDGHTTGPWEVDPTPETQSGGDFQARILARRAFDDGADAVITGFPLHGNRNDYSNIHFEPNARLIAAAPDLLAALRAAYAENDRLTKQLSIRDSVAQDYVVAMELMNYDIERLHAEIDRLRANALVWHTVTEDPATLPDAEDKVLVVSRGAFTAHLAALRAAYAEIDRLRAYALDWKIVTDDPATLPEEDRLCLVRFTEDPEDHERTKEAVTVCDSYGPRSFDNEDDWPHWRMVDTPYDAFSIFPGDRWAYIPEGQ